MDLLVLTGLYAILVPVVGTCVALLLLYGVIRVAVARGMRDHYRWMERNPPRGNGGSSSREPIRTYLGFNSAGVTSTSHTGDHDSMTSAHSHYQSGRVQDPKELAVKGELMTYLPYADDITLTRAAREWVRFVGRSPMPDEAGPGLRAEFLQWFGVDGTSSPTSAQ